MSASCVYGYGLYVCTVLSLTYLPVRLLSPPTAPLPSYQQTNLTRTKSAPSIRSSQLTTPTPHHTHESKQQHAAKASPLPHPFCTDPPTELVSTTNFHSMTPSTQRPPKPTSSLNSAPLSKKPRSEYPNSNTPSPNAKNPKISGETRRSIKTPAP